MIIAGHLIQGVKTFDWDESFCWQIHNQFQCDANNNISVEMANNCYFELIMGLISNYKLKWLLIHTK